MVFTRQDGNFYSWYFQVVTHKTEGCQDIPPEGLDISLTYNSPSDDHLELLGNRSSYCTQETFYHCNNAALRIDGEYGWYSHDGESRDFWPEKQSMNTL